MRLFNAASWGIHVSLLFHDMSFITIDDFNCFITIACSMGCATCDSNGCLTCDPGYFKHLTDTCEGMYQLVRM